MSSVSSGSGSGSRSRSGGERAERGERRDADGTFRVHARRKVSLRALVTHVERGWQRHAPVEDIGLGGARIVLDTPVRPGDAVTLSFTAPSLWDPLVLRARVAWVSSGEAPLRAGVAFDHRGASAAFALHELIATLAYE